MTDSKVEITLEDVLESIVGQHHPQGDTALDNVSERNMPKLNAIAFWVADELTLGGRLESYMDSQYGSMKYVARLHDATIMGMLEAFEPQVKRYYEQWLAGDDDDR